MCALWICQVLFSTFLSTSCSMSVFSHLVLSVFLALFCFDRSLKGFSLCTPVCPSLCSSPFVSLFLWCHSILTLLLWLCADLPLPLWVSVHSSVFRSPLPSLDFIRMWQKSLEPLCLCISRLSLPCCCCFPSKWCWKCKSCTSQHSRGWTSCTCEHKASGDAVTSRLFFSSVLLFSADISSNIKKVLGTHSRQGTSGVSKSQGKSEFLQMSQFAGI